MFIIHFFIYTGTIVWDNPRETGTGLFYENDELVYGGVLYGYRNFATLEDLQSREVIKGGSAIFMFNFEGKLSFSLLKINVKEH